MTPPSDFRLLTLSDVEQAAQVIAQAFVDDPLSEFVLPNRKTRPQTLLTLFRALGEVSIKNNRCYGVGDPLQGVAYWKFPDQEGVSVSLKSLGKFLPLLLTSYPIGLFRARAVMDHIDKMHEKYADGPHFYLDNIGVLSSARGRGVSSKLIRPFLEKADSQKVITYTETVTPSNVPLYEHFGFQCVEAAPIAGTGITTYALRRPAQPETRVP
jgi:ribosomal protein S18 acetylase RimI-like enzyme